MDALNYIQEISELSAAFDNVSRHLKPSGLFVFDALTEFGLKAYSASKLCLHISVNGTRCLMWFRYDSKNRVDETIVGFPHGGNATGEFRLSRQTLSLPPAMPACNC